MELLPRSLEKFSSVAELKNNSLPSAISLVTAMLLICTAPAPNIAINKLSVWANYPFLRTASAAISRISSLDRLLKGVNLKTIFFRIFRVFVRNWNYIFSTSKNNFFTPLECLIIASYEMLGEQLHHSSKLVKREDFL